MSARRGSFVRFIMVGMANTLIGLSVIFICLNLLGLNYWLSTVLGNVIGAAGSFIMNKRFTFRSEARTGSALWRFALVTAVCYGAAYPVGAAAAGKLLGGLFPAAGRAALDNSAALLGSGLYTLLNYYGLKRFAFGRRERATKAMEWESEA